MVLYLQGSYLASIRMPPLMAQVKDLSQHNDPIYMISLLPCVGAGFSAAVAAHRGKSFEAIFEGELALNLAIVLSEMHFFSTGPLP